MYRKKITDLKKKKILHVLDGFGIGGAETWLVAIVKYCREYHQNLQHDFLCTGGEKRIFDDQLYALGCKLFYIKYSTKNLLHFRSFVLPILREGGYTAIWNHEDYISGWQYMALSGYLPKVRLSYLHNPINQTWFYRTSFLRNFIFQTGKLLTAGLSTYTTGTSNEVMDEYGYNKWPLNRKRIAPIHCAFNPEDFTYSEKLRIQMRAELGIDTQTKVMLFVGRLSLEKGNPFPNQKNPDFAFKLAIELAKTSSNVRFLFVGDKGESGLRMEDEIKALNFGEKIKFLGPQRHMKGFYSIADLLIFPSIYEGLGMVAVEAQAAYLPCVISDRVPKEAIVDPALITTLELSLVKWKEFILDFIPFERSEVPNEKVLKSDFNIKICVDNVSHLLESGNNFKN